MDEYRYNCNYCGVEYTPRRRHVQKYCCSSCRVNAFNKRKKSNKSLSTIKKPEALPVKDQMSLSGIGNAAVGALAIDLATSLFTREENKPATKGDIEKILQGGIHKTILIRNIPPRMDGARAYFDTQQQILIYKK
jgi:transposase-like protein